MEYAIKLFRTLARRRSDDLVLQPLSAGKSAAVTVAFDPNSVLRFTAAMAACLLLVSLVVDVSLQSGVAGSGTLDKLSKIFSVDREANVASFFSMLLLLTASAQLASIAIVSRYQERGRHVYWAALSAGFLFMAFDEIAEVHERLIEPIRGMLGGTDLGVLYYAWIIPGVVVVLLCVAVFFRFWLNLPSRTRLLIFIAAALYLGGAIGIESLGGKHAEIYGRQNIAYVALTWAEEALEMAGCILFIKALFAHLSEVVNGSLTFHLTKDHTGGE